MEITPDEMKRAAKAHARTVLGDKEFDRNVDAVKAIVMDFMTGARWIIEEVKKGGTLEKVQN